MNSQTIEKCAGSAASEGEAGIRMMPLSEVKPQSFRTRYLHIGSGEYEISRGKSRLVRQGLIILFFSIFLMVVTLSLLPYEMVAGSSWKEFLIWTPRILAGSLLILGLVKLRGIRDIKSSVIYTPEGLQFADTAIKWNEIRSADVKYSVYNDDVFCLIIRTNTGTYELDLAKVDEISEDAAYVFHRYWHKYADSLPDQAQ